MDSEKREELKKELIKEGLYPREVERVLNIWEREEEGEVEVVSSEDVWEEVNS